MGRMIIESVRREWHMALPGFVLFGSLILAPMLVL
jgi:hypothetical protein